MKVILFSILIGLIMHSPDSRADDQVLDDQDIVNIEGLYTKPPPPPVAKPPSPTLEVEPQKAVDVENVQQTIKQEKVERLTDLNKLSPFREVSVIQKKYLPKTQRFQFFAAGGTTTNSPWFLNLGVKVNVGYFFTESMGLELSGTFLSNSERDVAKEIRENNGLQPEKFVNTKSHVGVDFVWAPVYGKVSFLNEQIIPFDMYFSAGIGSSSTNSQEGTNTTYHIGTGQIFALGKSMAFRWDYSWNFYQATPVPSNSISSTKPSSNTYNDLILTAGVSFFFPEVSNR